MGPSLSCIHYKSSVMYCDSFSPPFLFVYLFRATLLLTTHQGWSANRREKLCWVRALSLFICLALSQNLLYCFAAYIGNVGYDALMCCLHKPIRFCNRASVGTIIRLSLFSLSMLISCSLKWKKITEKHWILFCCCSRICPCACGNLSVSLKLKLYPVSFDLTLILTEMF